MDYNNCNQERGANRTSRSEATHNLIIHGNKEIVAGTALGEDMEFKKKLVTYLQVGATSTKGIEIIGKD